MTNFSWVLKLFIALKKLRQNPSNIKQLQIFLFLVIYLFDCAGS